jgi:hypothetical protein
MMTIPIPDEFKKACRNLAQGLSDERPSLEHLVEIALIGIEYHERPAIKAFLDELLDGRHSTEQLREFWWSTPADIYFHDAQDLLKFLMLLRGAVEKGP